MKNLIGNEWKTSKMGIVKVINPYNGDLIDTVPASSKEDILDAVDKAKKITKLWEEIGLFKRVAIIKDFIKLVSINKKRLSLRLSEETGKKYKDALFEINNLILISKSREKSRLFFCNAIKLILLLYLLFKKSTRFLLLLI